MDIFGMLFWYLFLTVLYLYSRASSDVKDKKSWLGRGIYMVTLVCISAHAFYTNDMTQYGSVQWNSLMIGTAPVAIIGVMISILRKWSWFNDPFSNTIGFLIVKWLYSDDVGKFEKDVGTISVTNETAEAVKKRLTEIKAEKMNITGRDIKWIKAADGVNFTKSDFLDELLKRPIKIKKDLIGEMCWLVLTILYVINIQWGSLTTATCKKPINSPPVVAASLDDDTDKKSQKYITD